MLVLCLLALFFVGCGEKEDPGALMQSTMDFEYFTYDTDTYIVILLSTDDGATCEVGVVVKCQYQNSSWFPGDEFVFIDCYFARMLLEEVRQKKSVTKTSFSRKREKRTPITSRELWRVILR